MLQSLTIRNFQAHKKLVVDFDPHVTTIIGPSDVGKSAVIRALRWLVTNRPSGDTFIRDGSKSTKVLLGLPSGETVHRERGTKNLYKLGAMEFKAFGNDVPPEVAHTLNLAEINFQGQHDSPFWFCETSGEVSRQLNKIVDLSIIDTTLSNLDKGTRAAKSKLIVIAERLKEAKALRSSLKSVRDMDAQLIRVEEMAQNCTTTIEKAARLNDLLKSAQDSQKEKKAAQIALDATKVVVQLGEEWYKRAEEKERLRLLLSQIKYLQEQAFQKIPDVNPLIKLKQKHKRTRKEMHELQLLLGDIRREQEEEKVMREKAIAVAAEWNEAMKGACPLCGRK